jgi:hypothetical protein
VIELIISRKQKKKISELEGRLFENIEEKKEKRIKRNEEC